MLKITWLDGETYITNGDSYKHITDKTTETYSKGKVVNILNREKLKSIEIIEENNERND